MLIPLGLLRCNQKLQQKTIYKKEIKTMARMNSVELTKELFRMAAEQTKYEMNWYTAIINAIMCQYATKSNYYEENAIATFKRFLESGVLTW